MMKLEKICKAKNYFWRRLCAYKKDRQFSKTLAWYRTKAEIESTLQFDEKANTSWRQVNKCIAEYVKQEISNSITKYKKSISICSGELNAPIWVCWWQGEETCPPLVRYCIQHIEENAGKHPVVFISKKTVSDYISIPDYILSKADRNEMKLANLADYIRCSLIAQYGGIWIDSTVFVSKQIPEEYFQREFYSVSSEKNNNERYIAKGRWATYVIGGWKNSKLFCFLKDAFEEYWEKNDSIIDYFLIDYIIDCAYNEFPDVRSLIDSLPTNNPHRFSFRDAMMKCETPENINKYLFNDTVFYKLSNRETYNLVTPEGKQTFYSLIINSLN